MVNFPLPTIEIKKSVAIGNTVNEVDALCKFHGIDLSSYKGTQRKDKIARNLMDAEIGLQIYNAALNILSKKKGELISLF